MKVVSFTVGQMAVNCFLFYNSKTNHCLIIDPGDEADFITDKLLQLKLTPKAILLTHGHFDHLLAAGEIQQTFKIPLAINFQDTFLVKRAIDSAKHWLGNQQVYLSPEPKIDLAKEINISLDNEKIKVIHTPGHTPGGSCFYHQKSRSLFTGDTLFPDGYPRDDFAYSSTTDLKKSQQKLSQFLPATVYPGHGQWKALNKLP